MDATIPYARIDLKKILTFSFPSILQGLSKLGGFFQGGFRIFFYIQLIRGDSGFLVTIKTGFSLLS
jgi:hypothetical protein